MVYYSGIDILLLSFDVWMSEKATESISHSNADAGYIICTFFPYNLSSGHSHKDHRTNPGSHHTEFKRTCCPHQQEHSQNLPARSSQRTKDISSDYGRHPVSSQKRLKHEKKQKFGNPVSHSSNPTTAFHIVHIVLRPLQHNLAFLESYLIRSCLCWVMLHCLLLQNGGSCTKNIAISTCLKPRPILQKWVCIANDLSRRSY